MRLRWIVLASALTAACTLAVAGVVSAAPGDNSLFAAMTGKKEVNTDGEKGVGDRNGRGSFAAVLDGRELCYGITVKNINDPVAAHIHRGGRNVAGPVVQPLTHPTSGDPGASSDCVNLSASLARSLRRKPSRFYVNVHTADFPDGAVRAQLATRP